MRCALLALLLLCAVPCAQAATCTVSATNVGFGGYNRLSAFDNASTGTVTVHCTTLLSLSLSYTVSLSAGSGTYTTRKLKSGSNTMNYNLYTDVLYAHIWGDGSGSTSTITSSQLLTVLGLTNNHTVYGRIPAGQNVAAGSYADTITVTVDY